MTNPIPINLHPHEARAAADGRLSLIIRPVDPQPLLAIGVLDPDRLYFVEDMGPGTQHYMGMTPFIEKHCPLGASGDRLWGRETWQAIYDSWGGPEYPMEIDREYAEKYPKEKGHWTAVYKADWGDESVEDRDFPWRSPIVMPRWACRAHMVNQAVRVARVGVVTEEEAGMTGSYLNRCACLEMNRKPRKPLEATFRQTGCHIHGTEFRTIWDTIYAKRGLGIEQNPWCWFVDVKGDDNA